MSVETISPDADPRPAAARLGASRRPRRAGGVIRPVVGVLAVGTAFYAPLGEVVVDDALVTCHLCGRALRSVAAHLRAHGWTKDAYCQAFGLERGQSSGRRLDLAGDRRRVRPAPVLAPPPGRRLRSHRSHALRRRRFTRSRRPARPSVRQP